MAPLRLEPAIAVFLCLLLAGLQVAGTVAVLRVLQVCRHHLDRLGELQVLEGNLKHQEEKLLKKRQAQEKSR